MVALGGGHGLAASLAALRRVVSDLTAVVTVADNGGSSGRLREEFGVLPPGDLRQALAALCGDDDWGRTWARVLQHRFSSDGEMDNHALGNLLIVTLWELLGDHVDGLDWVGRLLGAHGRVLPMAVTPLDITASVQGLDPDDPDALTTVRGQVEVASTSGRVTAVHLDPHDPPACREALAAVAAADWVVLGPGSWFTSVIPHLLVPELRQSLVQSAARKAVVLNLEPQVGETDGFSPERHLEVLAAHAPELRLDVVLADRAAVPDQPLLERVAGSLGAELVVADLAVADGSPRHDPVKLAVAYAGFSPGHKVAAAQRHRLVPGARSSGTSGLRGRCRRGRIGHMAMTAQVKAELAGTQVTKACCRKSEVSSMLRFAGGLHIVSGRIVVEAELDTGAAARRLRRDIAEVYGHPSDVVMVSGNGIRKGSRYVVRVVRDGEALARQTGLLDGRGRPVRGLPPQVVSGAGCDAVAAWRGAFLAHGSLTEPGRSSALEVTCPGPEAALALVGAARRIGIAAKAREVRGVDRVVIRDGDAIGQLLTRLGAHESLMAWEERRMRREVRATANRLANFDDANLRRSARAAVAAGARVERALQILADEVPDHLKMAGDLRLEHKQASLEELGQLHVPPLTKDAIAGRIRRLLAMADKRAQELGIDDTEASLTPDMLEDAEQA